MRDYPKFLNDDDVPSIVRHIVQQRKSDISDFNNLKNVFISGRKVGKIPSGAADVADTDRIGDFNYTDEYIYICVDDSGTAAWRRAALSSW
jgi:hypothetical protein